jgi:hypothetical protein
MDRPLFLPLKREFFLAFESGVKAEEWRRHGPGWNARVCWIGRPVVLSLGYRGTRRLRGVITGFHVAPAEGAAAELYGRDTPCAVIEIRIDPTRSA